jgi:Ca-activated chloride channel family protein
MKQNSEITCRTGGAVAAWSFVLRLLSIALLVLAVVPASAQTFRSRALASHVLVPHARPFAGAAGAQVSEVSADIDIVEQVATTTLDITVTNPGGARVEAEMIVPVPDGAALRGFQFQGSAPEAKAELLARDEARRIYDSIVAKTRDPALLEFIGFNVIRSSVFPVEARGTQRVRIVYEHLLAADGDRIDYVLPRSESIDYRVPWNVSLRIKSKSAVATVYSPSHKLNTARRSERELAAKLAPEAHTEPGPFRVSYLLQKHEVTASLLAYPDPKIGGGYFLLVASAPLKAPAESKVKREVTLVLDRSGSMAGEKLEQARAAALQVIEGLEDGEAFNIILFHEAVESFAESPVVKSRETMRDAREYIRNIRVRGGTNIRDALVEALRQRPMRGFLPIVLFLTDGLPTVGETSEKVIREVAMKGNPYERRIFTFGVGVDVNTPLLDKIAAETRATATFVLPKEDIEVKVGQVTKRLVGPVLAAPKLRVLDEDGAAARGRVRDLTPAKLPDLFEGDQLVLLGQYTGDDPLKFVVEGDYFGRARTFKFNFSLSKATVKNSFVPRLWASRKIATLTDAIRDLGAEADPLSNSTPKTNPRLKELVDEIVRLSKEFGILTEYTAFLAREGTDLTQPALVADAARKNFEERAIQTRFGYGSVNQEFNNGAQRSMTCVNTRNGFWDAQMNRVEISTVQQVAGGAFYKRGNRWVDGALVDRSDAPKRIVEIGSPEFRRLAERLARDGRQGCVALNGEILLTVDGETVLVR